MSDDKPEVGDKVSWTWGPSGTQPSGVVSEKKAEGEVAVESKRGNTITKKAKPDDPAVALERSGNPVVKNVSEIDVEEKNAKPELKNGSKNDDSSKGTKRKHDDTEKSEANGDAKKDEDKKDNEKETDDKKDDQKDEKKDEEKDEPKANGNAKKKAGRPPKAKETSKGEKKKPGRPPKDPNAPPAAKKQKKEVREGTRRSSRLKN